MRKRRSYLKRITLENRILLLLKQYDRYREDYTVPEAMSQGGMAKELAARQNHVSRAITELESKGLLSHRSSHVKNQKRRRRIYFLNEKGNEFTDAMIRGLDEKYLTVRTVEGSIEEWPLKNARRNVSKILERKVAIYEMLSGFITGNELDMGAVGLGGKTAPGSGRTRPRVKEFFGREEEILFLEESLRNKESKLISVISIAGQGKTSLLSRFIDTVGSEKVIWTSCNTYMGPSNFLNELSLRIRDFGAEGLLSYMTSEGRMDLYDAARAAVNDLSRTGAILVFEDLHKASEPLLDLLTAIKETVMEENHNVKIYFSSRIRPRIYNRTELALRPGLLELELEGLNREDARQMVTSREIPGDDFDKIYEITCGNPLALQLYLISGSLNFRDARFSLDRFIQEEMVSHLTDSEWRIVKLASLLRIPVYPQAFNVLEGLGEKTVKGLIDRMLLVEYPDGTCFLHEILKEPIQNKLNPSEIKALSQKALDYFSRKGSDLDLMETLYFSSLAGRSKTFRSYLMRYGEYLASRGYQQVWEMAESLKENELEAEENVNLFLIGFETALLRDDLPSATDMLSKAKKVCDTEIRSGGGKQWNKTMSRVLDRFGELARLEGISEKAIKSYKESLEVMRSTGDSLGEAKALNNLGVAYLDRGELNRAMDFFTDSEKILRARTDRKGLSYVHINMGNIQRIRGEMKKAGSLFERARLEAESTGAKNLELEAMVKLSELELESGNRDEGIEVLVSCISGYQDINDKRSMWECLERIMVPLMKKGDKKKAIKVLDGVIGQIHRRSRFFYKRSISDLEADDRTIALAITYFKSMVEGEERKARRDLRTYLNWCAVRLSSDAFLDEVKRLDRIAREVKGRVWLDMVYETALPSASLYDEVHPQVILLIKWSRKKYMDEKEKRMLLRKAYRLAREGGFEQGKRKARKLLDSLKIPS